MVDKKVHCLICAKDVEMTHLVGDMGMHQHCTSCPCEEEENAIVTRFGDKYYICEPCEVIPSLLAYEFYMDALSYSKEIADILYGDPDSLPPEFNKCQIAYKLAESKNEGLLEAIREFGKDINEKWLYSLWFRYKRLEEEQKAKSTEL